MNSNNMIIINDYVMILKKKPTNIEMNKRKKKKKRKNKIKNGLHRFFCISIISENWISLSNRIKLNSLHQISYNLKYKRMKNVFKRNIIIYIILIEFLLLLISNNILAYIYILNAFIIKFFFV